MKKISILLFGLFCFVFAGCNSIDNYGSNTQYKKGVATIKPIDVPKDLSSSKIESYYQVPAVKSSAPNNVSILPPGSKVKK